jgi:protein-L-isoaspartate(D-aspartate) O-methyltransferase
VAPGDPLTAYRRDRRRLVERLRESGLEDLAILHAFDAVPRHLFVPSALHGRAYDDEALPIGHGQTISRPSVHALHLQLAELQGGEAVLEVGTGSGFQTALLVTLGARVFSIEVVRELSARAERCLSELGLPARLRVGDGRAGWPAEAPFDVILVGAASPKIPGPLLAQLSDGGRLIIPVGDDREQTLQRLWRRGEDWERETVDAARFVPLIEG